MKILLTAPLKQSPGIFEAYQDSIDRLIIPDGVELDRFYVVNDCPEIVDQIRGDYVVRDTGDVYEKTHNDHIWTDENLCKMPMLRNLTIKAALDGGYDYWWSVDTDLVLDPNTLTALLEADKDIVSEVFWTQSKAGGWWCNGWMYDQADADGRLPQWTSPGLYQVGMTGALTLVKTQVFSAGVSYDPIPNIRKALWGEDRWFCIRAAVLGFEMWLDTHYPATHLFTEQIYQDYVRRSEDV